MANIEKTAYTTYIMTKYTLDTSDTSRNRKNESGNVLWFILIVLVLIGLLTAVLSRSGTSVDQSGDVEQQRIKINQMLRYVKGIEAAIQQMKLRGISESDLNFDPNGADSGNCTSGTCKVFHVDGGGLTHQTPPAGIGAANWLYVATNDALNVGTTEPDLILMLRNVSDGYCSQINRLLNVTQGAADSTIDFTAFTGTYTATQTINNAGGQSSGCQIYDTGGGNENFFYYVLVAR